MRRSSFLLFVLPLLACDALYDVRQPSGHLPDDAGADVTIRNTTDAALDAPDQTGDSSEGATEDATDASAPLPPGIWALPPVGASATFFADVNGDKRSDLIWVQGASLVVWLSDGTRFVPSDAQWGQLDVTPSYVGFADVTGDGRADGIEILGGGADGVAVLASSGTSFGSAVAWASGEVGGGSAAPIENQFAFADVTGDGKADVEEFDTGGIFVLASTGQTFSKAVNWTGDHEWAGDYCTTLADVTGDSKADALMCGSPNVAGFDAFIYAVSSTGSFFAIGSIEQWTTVPFWGHVATYFADVYADDGGNRADVIAVEEDIIFGLRSSGTGFSAITTDAPQDIWLQADFSQMTASAATDVNGDGKADFVAVELDGVHVWLSNGSSFVVPPPANDP